MKFYLNRIQWAILWLAVAVSAHLLLDLRLRDFFAGSRNHDNWGLAGYLYPAYTWHRSGLAATVVIIGLLLVWQASHWRIPRMTSRRAALGGMVAWYLGSALVLWPKWRPTDVELLNEPPPAGKVIFQVSPEDYILGTLEPKRPWALTTAVLLAPAGLYGIILSARTLKMK